MPLTDAQKQVFHVLAALRSADSVVAGGLPIARETARMSKDVDLFHSDIANTLRASNTDITALQQAGYPVALDQELEARTPQFMRRAVIGDGIDAVTLEWVTDADYRYFPAIPDPDFGMVISPIDIGVQKVLAAVGRSEIRDIADLVHISQRYLPLGALVAAATALDTGWTPEATLNEMSRNTKHRTEAYNTMPGLSRDDALAAVRTYRDMLREAKEFVSALPTAMLGRLFLENGTPVQPDVTRLQDYETHEPQRQGHWPVSHDIRSAMLHHRDNLAWGRFDPNVRQADAATISPVVATSTPLSTAIETWVTADPSMAAAAGLNLPLTPATATTLAAATLALNTLHPGAITTLRSALQHDPAVRTALTTATGSSRGAALEICLLREQAAAKDPNVRATRLVTAWHSAIISQVAAVKSGDVTLINTANADIRTSAHAIANDPSAIAAIRTRAAELGVRDGSSLGIALKSPDVGQALLAGIDPPARGIRR
jgi:Nucleotidyl transferase AbiEii toxin, Type IV TA system